MNVTIEPLNVDNWLKVCELSVSDEQKKYYTVPNVYWIGISRYEEKSELFAIKYGDEYVGMTGCGIDEDDISGFINPLMIDKEYQGRGIAFEAMHLMIDHIKREYNVPHINIGHRKENHAAGRLYEKLGFTQYGETNDEYLRRLDI